MFCISGSRLLKSIVTIRRCEAASKAHPFSQVRLKEAQFMTRFTKYIGLLSLLILIGVAAMPASAEAPGTHPFYQHALTDLRTARWLLGHQPGDRRVYAGEDVAIQEIDAAINEIKRASIDDGKDVNDHPNVDVKEQGSRLLRAIETLKKAHADIDREEDNPDVRDLRHRAQWHIDRATKAADQAHAEWLSDMGK
jgi:hypothetical protein